ncbi:hypothetical protein GLAREA_04390 [Glarea lozoyensis ATCC 20868]|uniref:Uncharacterized protein n=1 Tax=Glarea lozoyensis (strain ATCC 20868 / MF5171) TaxID=1116229 RepID=S3CR67_GLAL2|nr:uncharacterized protein GLAREA_04390 [Glarea lozoyensis ATCC 20868]EPE27599.1 hypothetical protein GLAREA_04390 [Glarea lozoyensis ATCC 20868]
MSGSQEGKVWLVVGYPLGLSTRYPSPFCWEEARRRATWFLTALHEATRACTEGERAASGTDEAWKGAGEKFQGSSALATTFNSFCWTSRGKGWAGRWPKILILTFPRARRLASTRNSELQTDPETGNLKPPGPPYNSGPRCNCELANVVDAGGDDEQVGEARYRWGVLSLQFHKTQSGPYERVLQIQLCIYWNQLFTPKQPLFRNSNTFCRAFIRGGPSKSPAVDRVSRISSAVSELPLLEDPSLVGAIGTVRLATPLTSSGDATVRECEVMMEALTLELELVRRPKTSSWYTFQSCLPEVSREK